MADGRLDRSGAVLRWRGQRLPQRGRGRCTCAAAGVEERLLLHRAVVSAAVIAAAGLLGRHEVPDRAVLLDQVGLRDAPDILGGHGGDLVEQRVHALVAVQHLPHAQQQRLAGHALARVGDLGAHLLEHLGHLVGAHAIVLDLLDLADQGGLDLGGGVPLVDRRVKLEQVRVVGGAVAAAGIGGQLGLDQRAVDAGAAVGLGAAAERHRLRARQHGVEHHQRREVGLAAAGGVVADLDILGRAGPPHDHAALALLLGLGAPEGRQRRASRQAAKILLGLLQHLVGLEIAHQHQHRVIGHIVGLVVVVEVLAGHRQQVALPADHLVAIGVNLEGGGHHRLAEPPLRVVLVALALRDDHRALALDLGRVEQRVDHAVGPRSAGPARSGRPAASRSRRYSRSR